MKRFTTSALLVLAIFFFANNCFSQSIDKMKSNGNSTGFWVIESNVKTPKLSTVLFYNNNQDLVYKEEVAGKKINIKKEKVRNQLNEVLQQSVAIWNKEKVAKENQAWVVKRK